MQLKSWIDIAAKIDCYPTGEAPLTVIRRTLVQDLPELAVNEEVFEDWLKRVNEEKWEAHQELSAVDVLRGMGNVLKSTRQPGAVYHGHAVKMSSCRTFFTNTDQLVGTAPARKTRQGLLEDLIHPGDVMAIISGLELPMILRAVGDDQDTYRLVTFAYVHGLMYGEAWENEDLRLSEINLI